MSKDANCQKCKLLMELYERIPEADRTNRDYWIFTELFFWLHGDRDYCDGKEPERKHKKFILMEYDDCYPAGGLNDIQESFDIKEDAIRRARNDRYNNKEIVDRDSWEIVWED